MCFIQSIFSHSCGGRNLYVFSLDSLAREWQHALFDSVGYVYIGDLSFLYLP
jgi:hypothetical protein